MSYMTYDLNYDIWRWRPYVSNKTAMVASALGLAAICMQDEIDPSLTGAALARADQLYQAWRDTHLASDGAYREGTLYAAWSLRNLIYYFEARKRFDGYDYSADPMLRAVEHWFPYELDPRGGARLNNIQDQTDYFLPLARHTTYWDWAMSSWGSPIAAYVWQHAAGIYGHDMMDAADKCGTVLWHQPIGPVNPSTLLPASAVWEDRGLYYYRTGWPDGASSDDVVFSFYSGVFHGGHAQEDQNQFTLTAYGEKLVSDNGYGSEARQSEAHNMVLIDGNGQHNAGGSIGTDGHIDSYVLGDFADYLCGNATLAYSTHSPYNDTGVPYPWSNWTWGLTGANPVQRALRHVIAVHGNGIAPYFVIQDDIQKDDSAHHYDWCLHVPEDAGVDFSGGEAAHVTEGGAVLDVLALNPDVPSLARSVVPFDNQCEDPNTRRIMLSVDAVVPDFAFVLLPRRESDAAPSVARQTDLWGTKMTLSWGDGSTDVVFARGPASGSGTEAAALLDAGPCAGPITTDATLGVLRLSPGGAIEGYAFAGATVMICGAAAVVRIDDGPADFVYDGTRVHLGREDAKFHIRAQGVSEVVYRDEVVPTVQDGDYLTNAVPSAAGGRVPVARLDVRAYPNPFNPTVRITFLNPSHARTVVTIHDAAGRRVAVLASRVMEAGEQSLAWDGRDAQGHAAASGVYFLRVKAGRAAETIKLVRVR
jgi:FlgD Ig-like domain/Heparinase II/III-like protein